MADGLVLAAIAENLADLSPFSTNRQTLVDAWNRLLENAGKDKLTQIDAVSNFENKIYLEFQDGDTTTLTSDSSGTEVNQLNANGDFSSNWWKTDGSYGANTRAADDSILKHNL